MLSDSNATLRTCFEYLIPSCYTVWRVMELLRWGPADGSGPLGPLKVLFSSEHTTSRFVLCEQPLPRVAPATDRTTSSYVPHCDSTKSECWGYRPVPPRGLSPLRLFLLGVLVTGRKIVTGTAVCKVIKHKQIVQLLHGVIKIQSGWHTWVEGQKFKVTFVSVMSWRPAWSVRVKNCYLHIAK